MKTKKMNLKTLKVNSFITGVKKDSDMQTIKSGMHFAIIKTINDAYCRDTGPAKCLIYTGHRACDHTC